MTNNLLGYVVLSGGFICHLILGCFYLTGTTNVYVVSYLMKWNKELSLNSMVVILPAIVIIQTCTLGLGPLLLKRFPPFVPLGIGTAVICAGCFLSSFAQSLTWYICLFALCMGFGNGICYITPIVVGWEYF